MRFYPSASARCRSLACRDSGQLSRSGTRRGDARTARRRSGTQAARRQADGYRQRPLHRRRRRCGDRVLPRQPRLHRGHAPGARVRDDVARRSAAGAQRSWRRTRRGAGHAGRHAAAARRLEPVLDRGQRPGRDGRPAARPGCQVPQRDRHRRRRQADPRRGPVRQSRSSCSSRRRPRRGCSIAGIPENYFARCVDQGLLRS